MSTRERPILFSGAMVRALLRAENPKTQTRRLESFDAINQNPSDFEFLKLGEFQGEPHAFFHQISTGNQVLVKCNKGQPGDRLWVKETHAPHPQHPLVRCAYQADLKSYGLDNGRASASEDSIGTVLGAPVSNPAKPWGGKWKPSIFMKRCYSRITLEITGVRVERLNEISGEDAFAEGVDIFPPDGPREPYFNAAKSRYLEIWESINGKNSWEKNPWVWVIQFKKL